MLRVGFTNAWESKKLPSYIICIEYEDKLLIHLFFSHGACKAFNETTRSQQKKQGPSRREGAAERHKRLRSTLVELHSS